MNNFQTLQDTLLLQNTQIPMWEFIINLIMVVFLSYVLQHVYARYGASLSNRKMFARNFVLLAMITMLIITIVKSSLALSLGLVGALSIVRFRSAIKEPEELLYLFFCIAIGLGFGANQGFITSIAFVITIIVIVLMRQQTSKEHNKNLLITVSAKNPKSVDPKAVTDTLSQFCSQVDLSRLDRKKDFFEASYQVDFENFEQLNKAQAALLSLDKSIEIVFMDHKYFSA